MSTPDNEPPAPAVTHQGIYGAVVLELLDRDTGNTRTVLAYPVTKVTFQKWTGSAWEAQAVYRVTVDIPSVRIEEQNPPTKWEQDQ